MTALIVQRLTRGVSRRLTGLAGAASPARRAAGAPGAEARLSSAGARGLRAIEPPHPGAAGMEQPGLDTRAVARRVLEHEGGGQAGAEELARAANRVCEKLHAELVDLFGPTGVHALIERALHLARHEYPFLAQVEPEPGRGGCLGILDDSLRGRDEAGASMVAVVSHLIALLVAFLGEELGVYPVRKIWPGAVEPAPGTA